MLALTALEARYPDVHGFLARSFDTGEGSDSVRKLLENKQLPDQADESPAGLALEFRF